MKLEDRDPLSILNRVLSTHFIPKRTKQKAVLTVVYHTILAQITNTISITVERIQQHSVYNPLPVVSPRGNRFGAGAVQKSEQRPPRSQSPYRVGSGPRGPPISPVALFTCTPPSSSSSSSSFSFSSPASATPLSPAASSPSAFGGGSVAELESARRMRRAGGGLGFCDRRERAEADAEARRRKQWLAAMVSLPCCCELRRGPFSVRPSRRLVCAIGKGRGARWWAVDATARVVREMWLVLSQAQSKRWASSNRPITKRGAVARFQPSCSPSEGEPFVSL
jgi:hypothetical protein